VLQVKVDDRFLQQLSWRKCKLSGLREKIRFILRQPKDFRPAKNGAGQRGGRPPIAPRQAAEAGSGKREAESTPG
jgi:hypothetical protein